MRTMDELFNSLEEQCILPYEDATIYWGMDNEKRTFFSHDINYKYDSRINDYANEMYSNTVYTKLFLDLETTKGVNRNILLAIHHF